MLGTWDKKVKVSFRMELGEHESLRVRTGGAGKDDRKRRSKEGCLRV